MQAWAELATPKSGTTYVRLSIYRSCVACTAKAWYKRWMLHAHAHGQAASIITWSAVPWLYCVAQHMHTKGLVQTVDLAHFAHMMQTICSRASGIFGKFTHTHTHDIKMQQKCKSTSRSNTSSIQLSKDGIHDALKLLLLVLESLHLRVHHVIRNFQEHTT